MLSIAVYLRFDQLSGLLQVNQLLHTLNHALHKLNLRGADAALVADVELACSHNRPGSKERPSSDECIQLDVQPVTNKVSEPLNRPLLRQQCSPSMIRQLPGGTAPCVSHTVTHRSGQEGSARHAHREPVGPLSHTGPPAHAHLHSAHAQAQTACQSKPVDSKPSCP